MSMVGLITIGILAPFKKVRAWHGRLYGIIGKDWGGLELGCFFVCGANCQSDYLLGHEAGHGLQNIIWGPIGIFVIFIPSAIRYWYRELKYHKHGLTPPTEYDSIWFEGQATRWGQKYILTDRI